MPTFPTPQPISVTLNLAVGDVHLVATDRTHTIVTVTPTDPTNSQDIEAAKRVLVDYAEGSLQIRQTLPWHYSKTRDIAALTITIEVPTGSHVRGNIALGTFHSEGRLGECELTSDYGDIQLGEIGNSLRVKGTVGSITVERAHADVDAKTTTGNIHVAEVIRGTVVLTTTAGGIELGIRNGTAARLDVRTKLGRVLNSLNAVQATNEYADTVKVRARTNLDDIVIRRT